MEYTIEIITSNGCTNDMLTNHFNANLPPLLHSSILNVNACSVAKMLIVQYTRFVKIVGNEDLFPQEDCREDLVRKHILTLFRPWYNGNIFILLDINGESTLHRWDPNSGSLISEQKMYYFLPSKKPSAIFPDLQFNLLRENLPFSLLIYKYSSCLSSPKQIYNVNQEMMKEKSNPSFCVGDSYIFGINHGSDFYMIVYDMKLVSRRNGNFVVDPTIIQIHVNLQKAIQAAYNGNSSITGKQLTDQLTNDSSPVDHVDIQGPLPFLVNLDEEEEEEYDEEDEDPPKYPLSSSMSSVSSSNKKPSSNAELARCKQELAKSRHEAIKNKQEAQFYKEKYTDMITLWNKISRKKKTFEEFTS